MSLEYRPETVDANYTNVEMVITPNSAEGAYGVQMICKNYDGTKVESIISLCAWSMGQFTITNSDRIEWFEEDGVLTIKHKALPETEDEADTDED